MIGIASSQNKTALYDAFAATGKALSNGKRLELLDLLAQGERSVDALATAAGVNLTTTSAHLQTLKQAGLVATRRNGVRIYYRLAGDDVAAMFALLRKVAEAHRADVHQARTAYLGTTDSENGPVVSRDQLFARVKAGDVIVLDVRPSEEYAAGHIPGAISIPIDQLADRVDELPDDVEVIAYCRGEYCVMAYEAVRLLTQRGRRAIRLRDGMLEWRLDERPIRSGATT